MELHNCLISYVHLVHFTLTCTYLNIVSDQVHPLWQRHSLMIMGLSGDYCALSVYKNVREWFKDQIIQVVGLSSKLPRSHSDLTSMGCLAHKKREFTEGPQLTKLTAQFQLAENISALPSERRKHVFRCMNWCKKVSRIVNGVIQDNSVNGNAFLMKEFNNEQPDYIQLMHLDAESTTADGLHFCQPRTESQGCRGP